MAQCIAEVNIENMSTSELSSNLQYDILCVWVIYGKSVL